MNHQNHTLNTTVLRPIAVVLMTAAMAHAAPIAWDVTKTGTQSWNNGDNWIGGEVPTTVDDATITGMAENVTIQNALPVGSLLIDKSGAGGIILDIASVAAIGGPYTADSLTIRNSSGAGLARADVPTTSGVRELDINGPILIESTGVGGTARFQIGGTGSSHLIKAESMTLTAAAGNAANLKLNPGPLTSAVWTFDIPEVIFNAGSVMDDWNTWSGLVKFTGDVTLQTGGGSGNQASFNTGRNGSTGTVRIDGNLTKTAGQINVRVGTTLDVRGNWNEGGGAHGTGTNGGGTYRLGGDLNIIGGASGNFNTIALTLDGDNGVQRLEVAVTDIDKTFRVAQLTLDNADLMLVDNHLNFAAGEYFSAMNLVNLGYSTLQLNGLGFHVEDADLWLQRGKAYTQFGGTVFVIPEPTSLALFGLALAALLRRQNRRISGT